MSFSEYCQAIEAAHSSGRATEHSYRPALAGLLARVGGAEIDAVNEPTHADYGAPDFILLRRGVPLGHIECKGVGRSLDNIEDSKQFVRYRDALPNLLLTDYLEFRWFVAGECRGAASLGRFDHSGALARDAAADEAVGQLLAAFFNADYPVVGDSADLARMMASKTRLLRDTIEEILTTDANNAVTLQALFASYREVLINCLTVAEFADLQAQSAAYGLFAARCLHSGSANKFNRQSAVFADTTPFLRDVFGYIAGPSADSRIAWIIDDLAYLLARADMAAVLEGFGTATRQEDPIVHFYEDFLAAYDPELRELRGVYYTPEPVVSYIVRSVDKLLRDRFALPDGLADTATVEVTSQDGASSKDEATRTLPRVLLLDPAAGTGTFLREVVAHIRDDLSRRGLGGAWGSYVNEHLLPRLFGFELLMAAYTICHLKLALEISADPEQFTLPGIQRLGVFLTNTLTEAHEEAGGPIFAGEIVREAREADAVKRDHPVMVVLGNPPYSGHSANKSKWISDLLRGRVAGDPQSYFHANGQPLDERNLKWLNDDYVKFIRFAQWRINRTGEGVLAFVTNHSYLDNPTFSGMRESLLKTFDEIWLLDLHGNSRRRERSPEGEPDQNVFDIAQGVAIGIFVKTGSASDGSSDGFATVRHADLWGLRGDAKTGKYAWLAENDVESTPWQELAPRAPDYFFVPRDHSLFSEYKRGWKLTDVLPEHSVGIVTARDKVAIQWSDADMRKVAADFAGLSEADAREKYELGDDSQDWKVAVAQQDLRSHSDPSEHIGPILYRPFDTRSTYFTGKTSGFICRPRTTVMRHMLTGNNLGLCVGRAGNVTGSQVWDIATVTDSPTDLNLFRRGGNCLFPLYLYAPDGGLLGLDLSVRSPNLAPGFVVSLAERTQMRFISEGSGDPETEFGPEDVFHYIYAVLHSPRYRSKYADFLRSDFPRVPAPVDGSTFVRLAALGARLTSVHLLYESGEELPVFAVGGTGSVSEVRYAEPTGNTPGRVWINDRQHFEGVSTETWRLTVGGYQPARKWLEDRRGRVLDFGAIETYRKICAALAETLTISGQIDKLIQI